jgi:lipopolysaccharide biosynthesis protein
LSDPDGIRTIAFYLPQFAPSPENDRWWGKGWTEWNNVQSAAPRWDGHVQPRTPADLGFYDLRVKHVLERQVALALAHNISAFCFYHYWSLGHRLLGRFLDEFLTSPQPDIPFCLSWGNHTWSRKWDGLDNGLLLEQHYSDGDDAEHIEFLLGVFEDPRYLRVHGKPLLVIHKASGLPNPNAFLSALRTACLATLGVDVYVLNTETSPAEAGVGAGWAFDGSIDFQPGGVESIPWIPDLALSPIRVSAPTPVREKPDGLVDYTMLAAQSRARVLARSEPPYRFPCVVPDWDNSARRPHDQAMIFLGSTPERYRRWVQSSRDLLLERPEQERLLFVNAWNEWGEGAYLEPDVRSGTAYLEAHLP